MRSLIVLGALVTTLMLSALPIAAADAPLPVPAPAPAAAAAPSACTAQDFATAVDQSGASLRTLTLAAQPKLEERMRRYQQAMKLDDAEFENKALDAIQDAKLDGLDKRSSELLLTVDSLGRVAEGAPLDCAKLDQVKAAAAELTTVIKAKSDYMLQRLDEKIAEAGGGSAPVKPDIVNAEAKADVQAAAPRKDPEVVAKSVSPEKPETAAKPESVVKSETPAKAASTPPKKTAPAAPRAKPAPAGTAVGSDWAAGTKSHDSYKGPKSSGPESGGREYGSPEVAMQEPGGNSALPPPEQNGYTIEEIRDATQGFFGTISTNLASVIEHAFKQLGRPTAYVLGTEGGGAFLAGLRFGNGELYMREQPGVRKVYWHGPSLGTDFGASGSRTIFLIYGMRDPDALYRNFTGIDGSAYFVGGVGLTVLKGGPVIMAPIRSGVGLRLGANLGYVRFTERPTWNPF